MCLKLKLHAIDNICLNHDWCNLVVTTLYQEKNTAQGGKIFPLKRVYVTR